MEEEGARGPLGRSHLYAGRLQAPPDHRFGKPSQVTNCPNSMASRVSRDEVLISWVTEYLQRSNTPSSRPRDLPVVRPVNVTAHFAPVRQQLASGSDQLGICAGKDDPISDAQATVAEQQPEEVWVDGSMASAIDVGCSRQLNMPFGGAVRVP